MKISRDRHFDDYDTLVTIFGELDGNLSRIEEAFDVKIFAGSSVMKITGEEKDVYDAISAIDAIETLSKRETLTKQQINMICDSVKSGHVASLGDLLGTVAITAKGKVIRPKSLGQKEYVDAIRKNKIVFGIGPAGTGKTYLAVALAVSALKSHDVERIILTRPAVEAGEKLGFLPGDLAEKVSGKYNVICANIVADVIIKLFENVSDFMDENGVLIISGIIDLRKDDVLTAAKKRGFTVLEEQYKDNWCAYVLKCN